MHAPGRIGIDFPRKNVHAVPTRQYAPGDLDSILFGPAGGGEMFYDHRYGQPFGVYFSTQGAGSSTLE